MLKNNFIKINKPTFILFIISFYISILSIPISFGGQKISLPTDNNNIYKGNLCKFYMYTDRTFEGKKSRPCSGGMWGFTRNQVRTKKGVVMKGFHEGIDIRPLYRDKNGEPLDNVKSIMDGKIVYVNNNTRLSNYGRYIVVEHNLSVGKFYSLYAHLAKSFVNVGEKVISGQKIARLGYTGRGINKRRAHVHVELNMIIQNKYFLKWHNKYYNDSNHHRYYNGLNMCGLNLADILKKTKKDKGLSFNLANYVLKQTPYYKVRIPVKNKKGNVNVQLLKNYPWLYKSNGINKPKSLDISFTKQGSPIKISASNNIVYLPQVNNIINTRYPYYYLTLSRITGSSDSAKLTKTGMKYIELFCGTEF